VGFAPPPNLPPPGSGQFVQAGFQPSLLPVASLCGFKIPFLRFIFGFLLPPLPFPPPIPIPFLMLGINCNLNNPLAVGAGVKFGGGRTINALPDPDTMEQAA
jgi:hypothetical protein